MSGPFAVTGLILIAISAAMAVSSLNELVRRRSFHHGYDRADSDYVHYDYVDAPETKIVTYLDSASKRYNS